MRLLPKSIHRCRRYPTKFNSGRDIPLRKSLATTNAIENLNGTIRRVSRNVKRWKSPSMIRRWTALGVVTAEKKFHRIKGYRHMGALVHALRSKQKSLDSDEFAA